MNTDIRKEDGRLLLEYTPQHGTEWIMDHFNRGDEITLKQVFTLSTQNLADPNEVGDNACEFVIGELTDEYYRLNPEILGTKNTFFLGQEVDVTIHWFITERNISILKKVDSLIEEDIYIGGRRDGAMPEAAFRELLQKFPNYYEITKYADARVGAVLKEYFDTVPDVEAAYRKYLDKKLDVHSSTLPEAFAEVDIARFRSAQSRLNLMLDGEDTYSEKQWQREILGIILLLYPKYIRAFTEAPVRDVYSKKNRSIDYLLVDATGNVDIVEIKKPFAQCIVSKRQYRDNYIPLKELSGTVMQVEKYIFYLNKWGKAGETKLTERYRDSLPDGFAIKIINPKGIIIMGREDNLTDDQKDDFEVIKRKYSNIIDIITYDDLLRRLNFMIAQVESGKRG